MCVLYFSTSFTLLCITMVARAAAAALAQDVFHLQAVGAKGLEHGVVQRQKEARAARVSLPPGPASQLAVDAARLVALRAQHHQAPELADL